MPAIIDLFHSHCFLVGLLSVGVHASNIYWDGYLLSLFFLWRDYRRGCVIHCVQIIRLQSGAIKNDKPRCELGANKYVDFGTISLAAKINTYINLYYSHCET